MKKIIALLHLARFHKPIGFYLLMWPCFWALAMFETSVSTYLFYLMSVVVLRCLGCIINDICDRKYDKHVERTKYRPLASGRLNMLEASIMLLVFASLAFVLWWQLREAAQYLSIIAGIMILCYPLMKRVTNFPQVFLGLTFSMVIPITWADQSFIGLQQDWPLWALLMGFNTLWAVFYDSIYGFADLSDDQKIGVKSITQLMLTAPKAYLTIINAIMCVLLIVFTFKMASVRIFIAVFATWFFQEYLIEKLNIHDAKNCITTFKTCHYLGFIIWITLLL